LTAADAFCGIYGFWVHFAIFCAFLAVCAFFGINFYAEDGCFVEK
jgi:hypothetical protein